jgi:hypothetical protein
VGWTGEGRGWDECYGVGGGVVMGVWVCGVWVCGVVGCGGGGGGGGVGACGQCKELSLAKRCHAKGS